MPRRSSRPRIPILAMFPYVSADLPYNRQALKIPTLVSTRPAFPAPQIRHPQVSTNSLRRLLARYRMSRRSIIPPRPATGLHKPTRPAGLLKFPASERPGVSADIRGGRCMLWSGLKPDRQSDLKARRPARQIAGLKVPHPGNPYS